MAPCNHETIMTMRMALVPERLGTLLASARPVDASMAMNAQRCARSPHGRHAAPCALRHGVPVAAQLPPILTHSRQVRIRETPRIRIRSGKTPTMTHVGCLGRFITNSTCTVGMCTYGDCTDVCPCVALRTPPCTKGSQRSRKTWLTLPPFPRGLQWVSHNAHTVYRHSP